MREYLLRVQMPGVRMRLHDKLSAMPYLYIDKVFHELRDELLTAMHKAVDSELRGGRVDVQRLYRSFTRAAAKQMANPVQVSDKCIEQHSTRTKKGSSVREDS